MDSSFLPSLPEVDESNNENNEMYENTRDENYENEEFNDDTDYNQMGGSPRREKDDADNQSDTSSDSDESINTCEILKVDPLMIRLNCFLKSENGETIVQILKDIRDQLSVLNKKLSERNS